MRRLVFAAEALADLHAGYLWYEAQRVGLGSEFEQAVEAAVAKIQRTPESFKPTWPPFRRIALRRFPFEIHYRFDEGVVTVALVFHTSQDPKRLRRRLGA